MSIQRAKPFRIPVSVFPAGEDEMYLFCLPNSGRNALLSNANRLLWSRVWTDDEGNEVELDDQQSAMMELTIMALCEGVKVNDIVNALNQINQTLLNLEAPMATATATANADCHEGENNMSGCGCGCCNCNGGGQQQNQQTVQEIYESLSPLELEYFTDLLCDPDLPVNDYKCRAINYIVDGWIGTNREIQEANSFGGLFVAVLEGILLKKNWLNPTTVVLLGIIEWLLSKFTGGVGSAYDTMIIANRKALVDAMYAASDPYGSRDASFSVIKKSGANILLIDYFWVFNGVGTNWNLIYQDDGTVPDDYPITTPCADTFPDDQPPTGWKLEAMPVAMTTESNVRITQLDNHILDWRWVNDGSLDSSAPADCDALVEAAQTLPAVNGAGYLINITNLVHTGGSSAPVMVGDGTGDLRGLQNQFTGVQGNIQLRGADISNHPELSDWLDVVPAQYRDDNPLAGDELGFRHDSALTTDIASGSMKVEYYRIVPDV